MKFFKKERGFTRTPKFGVTPKGGGFTLIELMVVVAIIAILAAVVVAALNNARGKGGDAGVQSNLRNAIPQAELFFSNSTPNSYAGVCTNSSTGIGSIVYAAAKDAGVSGAGINTNPLTPGSGTQATCHASANAWAAEVPLSGSTTSAPVMWCIDNTGKSQKENSNITNSSGAYQYACQ
jgi:type IV pilus assembly protein PilA